MQINNLIRNTVNNEGRSKRDKVFETLANMYKYAASNLNGGYGGLNYKLKLTGKRGLDQLHLCRGSAVE